MKTVQVKSNMLQKLVGFEPMSVAETEMVVGGDNKDAKANPRSKVTKGKTTAIKPKITLLK